ncbi:hypothetical protein GXW74_09275 [Roseomonas eburnea]|uniref:Secreted protein n=1 Tax=Neoroseomonas eburnea TaxID=1346889 RepID=A0A9X9XAE2_9PROT|nr:hypothetical protein [Neoroseomonas eburnea]MBR0680678.1 hypothetical protein [Neoroseomonas eburnea]
MIALSLAFLLQAVPPPFAQLVSTMMFGVTARPIEYVVPAPPALPAAPPAEDCRCGIPSSPRGPR